MKQLSNSRSKKIQNLPLTIYCINRMNFTIVALAIMAKVFDQKNMKQSLKLMRHPSDRLFKIGDAFSMHVILLSLLLLPKFDK